MFFRLVSLELFLGLQCLVMVMALPLAMQSHGSIARDSLRSYNVPILKRRIADVMHSKRDELSVLSGSVTLGDNDDLYVASLLDVDLLPQQIFRLYTVPLKLGDTVVAVHLGWMYFLSGDKLYSSGFHLDTGSSDLWVISDACQSTLCTNSNLPRYSSSSLNASGLDVTMDYGDSKTGSYASGPIGSDTATIAGMAMLNQQFAAINATTNPTLQYGASGIFGVGFPGGRHLSFSYFCCAIFTKNFQQCNSSRHCEPECEIRFCLTFQES
jgi:hypothetical protein